MFLQAFLYTNVAMEIEQNWYKTWSEFRV